VRRLWDGLRSRLPGRRAGAGAEPAEAGIEAVTPTFEEPMAAATLVGGPPASGRRRYRDQVMGLLLILGLSGVIVGVLGWQLGWFDSRPRPQELLRERLESVPPGPPVATGPRTVAAAPSRPSASASVPVAADPASGAAPSAPAAAPPPAIPAAPVGPAIAPPVDEGRVAASAPPPAAAPPPAGASGPIADASPPDGRFAVEFGPFSTPPEAERVERQLGEAGFQTVRFRQQAGGGLYAVLVERVPTTREAQALVSALREQGFGDAVVLAGAEPLNVRVGPALPLRGAVLLAERLRTRGHAVRVAAQPGEAVNFLIRHGNFVSRREAEERAAALTRLGLANHVVRVK
jgi:hypothetical protein